MTTVKERANKAVGRAVKRGELVRPSACQMCGRAGVRIVAHHIDYARPLDVTWLCTSCRARQHGPFAGLPRTLVLA